MLDFAALHARTRTFADLVAPLTPLDLHHQTDEMIDRMRAIIFDAADADVIFVPSDPQAHDSFGKSEEAEMAWTLGHVIVHATASAEESAALSTIMARGLVPEGRSRYETDWRTVHTVAQLRARLEESRRMRHAFLTAWPTAPHLEVIYQPYTSMAPINAIGRFIFGLAHDFDHLDQLREIMRQARVARAILA